MTPAELTVIAALGASALTGLASLGVVAFQEWRPGKASDQDALHAAVIELLSRSLAIAMRGQAMGYTMKIRSGLKEGFDIAMRQRKLVDPLELHDWMAQDWVPLNAALSEIWARWDQEGIRLANDVAGKAADLLGACTTTTPARSGWEHARIWAAGERWTPEMAADAQRAVQDLAHSRKRLADYARDKLCMARVDLFAQVETDNTSVSVAARDPAEPASVPAPQG